MHSRTRQIAGSECIASRFGRFTPGERDDEPITEEDGRIPKRVWRWWHKKTPFPAENRSPTVYFLDSHFTD
jgi:hypothetical protein